MVKLAGPEPGVDVCAVAEGPKRKRERGPFKTNCSASIVPVYPSNRQMSDLRTRAQALQARDGVTETPANVTTVQFVDGLVPESEGPKRPPKLHHKKSRTGCQRCRTRRVKVYPSSHSFPFLSRRKSLPGLNYLSLSNLREQCQNLMSFPRGLSLYVSFRLEV